MTATTITICYREIEAEVEVEGEVYTVPHRMGHMDEEPGTFIEDMGYYHPATGKPVSERLAKWIDKNYSDTAGEALAEAANGW